MSTLTPQATQAIIQLTGMSPVAAQQGNAFREQLAAHIHALLNTDFPALVSILYRLDVSEQKLKRLLQERAGEDAGYIIADLVIERELQKIATRKQFSAPASDIDEAEKW